MVLWWEWYRCVRELRVLCTRRRTFLWRVVVLIGLTVRTDLAGLSRVVQALKLTADSYHRLLALCHSAAARQVHDLGLSNRSRSGGPPVLV